MVYQRSVLKNGLRVILIPMKEVQSATTLVMIGAGSRYETKNNNGISHFLEHMAFKGTEKRPTALEISTIIDGIGAESNAFTGKEVTGYYIKSASTHVGLALDILADMLTHLKLDSDEINKERGVILEEINMYEDTPMKKIGDILETLLYGDVPMGWDITGGKDIINKISRDDFLSYMRKLYSADNMVVVVAGNIDTDVTLLEIEKSFAGLSSFEKQDFLHVTEKQDSPTVFIKQKKTEQAHFALGLRTVGMQDEKERNALNVLSSVMGGGMSSRLFHEVREKRGLAYYVRTMSENYVDVGYMATYASVDPKRIEESITVCIEEHTKILRNGEITEAELKKAKEYVKGHFILDLEDTRSVAGFYATQELLEPKIETTEEAIQKLESVNLADVLNVAQKYIKDKPYSLALIGDFEDKDRFLKLLL